MGAIIFFAFPLVAAGPAATRPHAAVPTCVFRALTRAGRRFGVQVTAYQIFLFARLGVTIVRSLRPGWHPRMVVCSIWFGAFLLNGNCWSISPYLRSL